MKHNEILILSVFLLSYFLWFAIPVSFVGTEDFRMADAFDVDESESLLLLKNEVKNHEFNMRFYNYGHLYYNSGLLPLIIADNFFHPSDKTVMMVFRLLSALYFCATILIVFLLGKKFFGNITAWLSVILMLTTSTQLLEYSVNLHPDTAQIFFISLSIFFCCKYFDSDNIRNWKYLAFASFAAGLAFSTKYAGITLLPLIVGIDLIEKRNGQSASILRMKSWAAVFFCIFSVILLNENWIIKYVPLNENSKGFFMFFALIRFLSAGAGILIIISAIFSEKFSRNLLLSRLNEKVINIVLFSAIFSIAFSISSPGCVKQLNFLNGFIYVTDAGRNGHWFNTSLGFSGWLNILLSKALINYSIFIFFLINAFLIIFFAIKKKIQKIHFPLIMFSWIIIYFTTLVFKINAGFPHYLLPVIPFIILLSANGIENIIHLIMTRTALLNINKLQLTVAVLIIVFGYENFQSFHEIYQTRNDLKNKVENSVAVKAGLWLKENFPAETIILYDRYSYVPDKFINGMASWGITQKQISETSPNVIMINARIFQRFSNAAKAASFITGSEEFLEKHNCYKSLINGNSSYKLLQDFGEIKIYRNFAK